MFRTLKQKMLKKMSESCSIRVFIFGTNVGYGTVSRWNDVLSFLCFATINSERLQQLPATYWVTECGDSLKKVVRRNHTVVQASIDCSARVLFPIHGSKFDLALHPWDELAIRLTKEERNTNLAVATPLIGEACDVNNYPEI